jgi:tRNA(Ile)-lysidine synthase
MACETRIGLQFSVDALNRHHPAEQRRILRRAIRNTKGDLRSIDLSHTEALRKLIESKAGHDRILLPGVDALRSFGILLLAKPGVIGDEARHYQISLEFGRELALPYDGGRLYVNWIKTAGENCGNFGVDASSAQESVDFDGDSLLLAGKPDGLYIRNWEPGDEYLRTGHEKPEKIKSLFQEHRIVLWDRRRWPVLVLNDEIVWSLRFGPAAKFAARGESRSVLRLLYRM